MSIKNKWAVTLPLASRPLVSANSATYCFPATRTDHEAYSLGTVAALSEGLSCAVAIGLHISAIIADLIFYRPATLRPPAVLHLFLVFQYN